MNVVCLMVLFAFARDTIKLFELSWAHRMSTAINWQQCASYK